MAKAQVQDSIPNAGDFRFATGQAVSPVGATPVVPHVLDTLMGAGSGTSIAQQVATGRTATGDSIISPTNPSASTPTTPSTAGVTAPVSPGLSVPSVSSDEDRNKAVNEYLSGISDENAVTAERKKYADTLTTQGTIGDYLAKLQKDQGIPDLMGRLQNVRDVAAEETIKQREAERQMPTGSGFVTSTGLVNLRAADSKEYIQKLADLATIENATVSNINARNTLIQQSLEARKQDLLDQKSAFDARIAALSVSDDRKTALKAVLDAKLNAIAAKEKNAADTAMLQNKQLLETGNINSSDRSLRKTAVINAIKNMTSPYEKLGVTLTVPAEAHAEAILNRMDRGESFESAFNTDFAQPFLEKQDVKNLRDQLTGGEWKTTSIASTDTYGNRTETPVFYRMKGNEIEARDVYGNSIDPTKLGSASSIPGKPTPGTANYNKLYATGNQKLRDDMTNDATIKSYTDLASNFNAMSRLYQDAERAGLSKESLSAVDQGLVTLFNKMLDPGSVVREGEYARTAEGQSVIDQATSFLNKLKSGGAGISNSTRQQMVKVAQTLMNAAAKPYSAKRDTYIKTAQQLGADPDFVTSYLKEVESGTPNKTGADYLQQIKSSGGTTTKTAGQPSDTDILSGRGSTLPAQKIDADIKRVAPKSATNGKMIDASATKYGVDSHALAAFLANDSQYGTRGLGSKNNNPGNVGQYDRYGNTAVKGYSTIEEGVDAVAQNLAKRTEAYRKATGGKEPTPEELASGVTSTGVKFYAPYMTDKQGPTRIRNIYNRISNLT